MANVQVIQRNAHLAGGVRLEMVNGREGKVAKAMLTAISNNRRGPAEAREDEATAIQWTLWGKQAENATARRAPHVVSHRFMPKVFCGLSTKQSLHLVSSQPTSSSSQ